MSMYNIFESAMSTQFDLSAMIDKINRHNIMGSLTDDERDKLLNLAREKANPAGGLDVMAKLQEMEERIRALEKHHEAPEGGTAETMDEYVPGKWYSAGDKVAFEGKRYVCIAPAGVVCVWSPVEYPAYWELVE